MNIERLLKTAIRPALAELADLGIKPSREAERFLVAIALQESRAKHRKQLGQQGLPTGPANSYLQFERGGGVRGVLRHKATAQRIGKILADYDIGNTEQEVWEAMRYHDILAFCMGRLLIYTLPNALPTTAEEGWRQYLDAWRPGDPHPETWAAFWRQADEATK